MAEKWSIKRAAIWGAAIGAAIQLVLSALQGQFALVASFGIGAMVGRTIGILIGGATLPAVLFVVVALINNALVRRAERKG